MCRRLLEREPRLRYSVSSTTRAPREGERNGVDYDFLSREEFLRLAEAGDFLEYAEVHGNFYGTRARQVETFFEEGYSVLLDVDVQGADLIREALRAEGNARLRAAFTDVFISPPSLEVLRERLQGRGQDGQAVIERRLKNAETEMSRAEHYGYQVVNDDLELAFEELASVFQAATLRTIVVPTSGETDCL